VGASNDFNGFWFSQYLTGPIQEPANMGYLSLDCFSCRICSCVKSCLNVFIFTKVFIFQLL